MSDERFETSLEYLWDVGHDHLPSMAAMHGDAAGRIHRSRVHDGLVFFKPGTGGTERSHAFTRWLELRDLVQRLAGETAVNLRDTGAALVTIAKDYADTDDEARDVLKEHITDYAGVAPDTIPDPPMPGDPQLYEGT